MIRKLIIPIVFIAGMLIFFYPIVSNWLSAKDHYTVISMHNEELSKMSEQELEVQKEKAEKYNETINESSIPLSDPFAEDFDETVVTGYFDILDIGETMGSVEIPSIDVELPIYHGVGDEVLQRGIGHMSNSSLPTGGLGTHSALTGHRGLPSSKLFRNLDQVTEGELFFIHTLGETLAYQVDDIQVVLPDETNWLDIDDEKDYVTLITCEPYMINTHRILVRGERVPYEPEAMVSSAQDSNDNVINDNKWLLIGGILVIIIVVSYVMRKKRLRKSEYDV